MRVLSLGIVVLLLSVSGQIATPAQDQVTIRVNAAQKIAPFQPIYAFFGYDEPNYTYAKNGSKLVIELAALTHFLLATGDGTPELKWGSTNAYVEDANGVAVYDWTIVDRIFDTYLHAHARPFVDLGRVHQQQSQYQRGPCEQLEPPSSQKDGGLLCPHFK